MPGKFGRIVSVALVLALGSASGCGPSFGFVPAHRLADAGRYNQTLQAETSQLKDVVLRLRAQNDDLSQRAVADLRRLQSQEETIRHLEQSVLAYQKVRDQMTDALTQIRRDIQASLTQVPASLLAEVRRVAEETPGADYDAEVACLSVPIEDVFEARETVPKPSASELIRRIASAVAPNGEQTVNLRIVAAADPETIVRAGYLHDDALPKRIGLDRAARVRDALLRQPGISGSWISVAPREVPADGSTPVARLEFHVVPRDVKLSVDPHDLRKPNAPH